MRNRSPRNTFWPATGTATIPIGSFGNQPVAVDMQGFISPTGAISFLVIVNPRSGATLQFGSVRYIGSGVKK